MFSVVVEPKAVSSWFLRFPASEAKEYPLGLPRHQRLRRTVDIQRVQRKGTRIRCQCLMVLFLPNATGSTRVALTVSRKVGNAVNRNRVKRWIRESVRSQTDRIPRGFDVVVIAHPQSVGANLQTIRNDLARGWDRLEAVG